ncbi:tetratricopeptide repeat protein [Cystobacter fuscus]
MRAFRALCLLWLLTGCGLPRAYERARGADTVEAYREFLRQYPEGDEAEAVQVRIAELEFEEAKRLHSVVAYKRFIEAHPEDSHVRAARALLEGLRFNVAKDEGTAAALRQFLRDHPDGAQREEARRLLKAAELEEASSTRIRRACGSTSRRRRRIPGGWRWSRAWTTRASPGRRGRRSCSPTCVTSRRGVTGSRPR